MVNRVFMNTPHVTDHFGPVKSELPATDLSKQFSATKKIAQPGISFVGTPSEHAQVIGNTSTNFVKAVAMDAMATVAQLIPARKGSMLENLQDAKMKATANSAAQLRQAASAISPGEVLSSLFGNPLRETLSSVLSGAQQKYANGIQISPKETEAVTSGLLLAGMVIATKKGGSTSFTVGSSDAVFTAHVANNGSKTKFVIENGKESIRAHIKGNTLTVAPKGGETGGLFEALNAAVITAGHKVDQLNLIVPTTHPVLKMPLKDGPIADLFSGVINRNIVADGGGSRFGSAYMLNQNFLPPTFAMRVDQVASRQNFSTLLPGAKLHGVPRFDPQSGNVNLVFKSSNDLGLAETLNKTDGFTSSVKKSVKNIMGILHSTY